MKDTFTRMLHFRHACKAFDPNKKISKQDFDYILEAARLSPSSFGFEPWKLLAVQNEPLREALKHHTWGGQKQIPTCSHLVAVLARKSYFMNFDSDYITHIMKDIKHLDSETQAARREKYENFQKSEFDLYGNERAMFDWACKQTYLAMAHMMLAAAVLGIDTCPIEGFDKKEIDNTLCRDFGIDTERFGISYMIAFGYRVNDETPKTRQPVEDIVQRFD